MPPPPLSGALAVLEPRQPIPNLDVKGHRGYNTDPHSPVTGIGRPSIGTKDQPLIETLQFAVELDSKLLSCVTSGLQGVYEGGFAVLGPRGTPRPTARSSPPLDLLDMK